MEKKEEKYFEKQHKSEEDGKGRKRIHNKAGEWRVGAVSRWEREMADGVG